MYCTVGYYVLHGWLLCTARLPTVYCTVAYCVLHRWWSESVIHLFLSPPSSPPVGCLRRSSPPYGEDRMIHVSIFPPNPNPLTNESMPPLDQLISGD